MIIRPPSMRDRLLLPEHAFICGRHRNNEAGRRPLEFLLNPYRFGGAAPTDPDYSSVSLLLHCDGTNGSTSFPDNGPASRTVTAVGAAAVQTAQSKFGGASLGTFISGSAGHLTVADNAAFEFGSGDFTIETWAYLTTTSAAIISTKSANTTLYPFQLWINGSAKLAFRGYNFAGSALLYDLAGTTTLTTGTWHFVQARRNGTTFDLYLNGSLEASTTASGALYVNTGVTTVGDYASGSVSSVRGYLDDFRITKGVVRSTSVPGSAFPNS